PLADRRAGKISRGHQRDRNQAKAVIRPKGTGRGAPIGRVSGDAYSVTRGSSVFSELRRRMLAKCAFAGCLSTGRLVDRYDYFSYIICAPHPNDFYIFLNKSLILKNSGLLGLRVLGLRVTSFGGTND